MKVEVSMVGAEPRPGQGGPEQGTQEKPEEAQKIEAIFARVNEVNQQLDGGVAHQIPTKDDSITLLFSTAARGYGPHGIAFGVNSIRGPVTFSEEMNKQLLPTGQLSTLAPDSFDIFDLKSVGDFGEQMLKEWEEAFKRSKDVVLQNRERMGKIRAERNKYLDRALDIVSEPVNIDAVPPKA